VLAGEIGANGPFPHPRLSAVELPDDRRTLASVHEHMDVTAVFAILIQLWPTRGTRAKSRVQYVHGEAQHMALEVSERGELRT